MRRCYRIEFRSGYVSDPLDWKTVLEVVARDRRINTSQAIVKVSRA